MNQPLNSRDQHGDLNWVAESWDNSNAAGALEVRAYQGSRLDWDWENSMILAQSAPGAGAGECSDHGYEDHKPQILSGLVTPSMRPYIGPLSSNFGSCFPHSNIGLMEHSGIQAFGGLDLSHNLSNSSAIHGSAFGFSNFPGLPSANIHQTDYRFFDQHRNRLLGSLTSDQKSSTDVIKPNDIYSTDTHSRIGLNLGFRTYFSTEDTIFGRLGKRPRANSPGSLQVPICQAEGCKADLSNAKHYHRRHKVCELHSKAAIVIANGQNQRFCQQCSRFQPLSEFDEGKRSCRKRLADHNRRRRKPQPVASTSNVGAASEPLALKADEQEEAGISHAHGTTEGKSGLQQLKNGSSSSGSLDNSGSRTTSAVDNIQLRATSRYSPQAESSSGLCSSQSSPITVSDHSKSISVSPSMPLLWRNNNTKAPKLSCQPHDFIPQKFLQGVGGQKVTNLSLSSSEPGGLARQSKGESSCQNYHPAANTFPWLRSTLAKADLTLSATKPHQLRSETTDLNTIAAGISAECTSDIPALSPSITNLLPSRDIERSDWILKNITGRTQSPISQFKASSINSPGSLKNNQGLSFLDCTAITADTPAPHSRTPVEFLQHKSTFDSVNNDEGEATTGQITALKFPELQSLRQFGSIYDPNMNLL
ncbi:hypothetical protein O6H91_16G069000 [Diphasiastrum complanatum]|uniref:Uncharacterized protein n=1 Tax=Diphasiastrum complanatum TaxID=34168 RepID=A0ACC2BD85_DIPCM|nr:hypothetical protein O6H91_16G069000 [Diphasiastrum complanatum]